MHDDDRAKGEVCLMWADENALLAAHERRIAALARSYCGDSAIREDLMQEGRLALLAAARDKDPSISAELWTYAKKRVCWAMLKVIMREAKEPCLQGDNKVNEHGETALDVLQSPPPETDEKLDFSRLLIRIDRIRSELDGLEREVLEMALDSLGVRTIGEELGLSYPTASRIRKRVIKRLQEDLRGSQ